MQYPSLIQLPMWKFALPSVARRYTIYIAVAGAVYAVINLSEVIARKSLGASGLWITILAMSFPLASMTSIWWAGLLVGRDQRKTVWWVGLGGNLALLTGLMLTGFGHFFIILVLFYLSAAIMGPAENRILQQHVPSKQTGKIFGNAFGIRMAIAAVISAGAGFYLERFDGGYRHLYFIAGLIGIAMVAVLASIPTKPNADAHPKRDWNPLTSYREVQALLKRRPDYLRFETAFMVYGMAFMMLLPVVPLYLVDDLALSYEVLGTARGSILQLAMIPFIPVFGRMFDRSTPHRMAAMVFPLLAAYPLLLLAAGRVEGIMKLVLVYTAFGAFGVMMSGVMVLWNLSSMRFARGEDAGTYQSVHIAMTGIRGSFAPMIGYVVMILLGKEAAMLTSAALWIVAGAVMVWMRRIDQKQGVAVSLRAA